MFQESYGSLGEINILMLYSYWWHEGITVEESRHIFIHTLPVYSRLFGKNIGFIIISVLAGILFGVSGHLLMKKRYARE